MSDTTQQILGEYTSGKVHECRVTVTWLEAEYDEYDDSYHHFVRLTVEVWTGDDGTLDFPDHWQIDWCHFTSVIADGLEQFLQEYCPYTDAVNDILETAATVPLPEELKGLFPRKEVREV